jgi:hypothetical protein
MPQELGALAVPDLAAHREAQFSSCSSVPARGRRLRRPGPPQAGRAAAPGISSRFSVTVTAEIVDPRVLAKCMHGALDEDLVQNSGQDPGWDRGNDKN